MKSHSPKYIFVTGGVASSLGKGVVSASLAVLLQARGYAVTIQKLDPYINIDPGTLNPYEHGETYVTEDGAETDLDLGHYERFLNAPTSQANNVTTGRIYETVIARERRGEYNGKTVQVVPHITDEIKRRIQTLGSTGAYQIVITEIGGTVGDIESLPFLEAARQLKYELNRTDVLFVHLTLIPFVAAAGELKTKPTQHSVKQLMQYGVMADLLVCRTERPITPELKSKLAQFCNVDQGAVVSAPDATSIYEVPFLLLEERMDRVVLDKLGLKFGKEPDLSAWKECLRRMATPTQSVRIAVVGKYVELPDSYKSILEALMHAGVAHHVKVETVLVQSEELTDANVKEKLTGMNGVLVAPGFGVRGIAGKLAAIRYVREAGVPFLGVCLGMQMAVVEFARNVLGFSDAHSTEMNAETTHPVIALMKSQKNLSQLGGTMRLGAYPCDLRPDSLAAKLYEKNAISERHRHRYEFNNEFADDFEKGGMRLSGKNTEHNLVEMIELSAHPFFVGCQFHPEYKSSMLNPHPLFRGLVAAALVNQF